MHNVWAYDIYNTEFEKYLSLYHVLPCVIQSDNYKYLSLYDTLFYMNLLLEFMSVYLMSREYSVNL